MFIPKDRENVINFVFDSSVELNLEQFLQREEVSNRLFRKLYLDKKILVNGRFQRKGIELDKGDIVSLLLDSEEENIEAFEMDLDIIYEDFDLLIINKDPNIVVHPTKSHQSKTLSNGIKYYFNKNDVHQKIRFVNRLDMDTSGIIIVAKNSFAHQQMSLQFENHTVEKKYLAIVKGILEKDSDTIDLPIGREEERSIKKLVTETGQEAITSYKVLERYKDASLLEVQIYTGRSHQIRVHMDYIGHPIIGDTLYSESSNQINRQALHSYYLKAKHPRTRNDIEFFASMPLDMQRLKSLMKD